MSMSTASNWLWNFGIGYATPYLVNDGPGNANLGVKVFFIWGSTCVGCLLFTYFLIPETKGLSLEQIDILYQNTNAIHSVAYRRQLIAEDVHAADPEAIARVTSKVDQEHGLHGLRSTKSRDGHNEKVDLEHKTWAEVRGKASVRTPTELTRERRGWACRDNNRVFGIQLANMVRGCQIQKHFTEDSGVTEPPQVPPHPAQRRLDEPILRPTPFYKPPSSLSVIIMAGGPVAAGGGLGGDGGFAGILMTAFAAFGGILYGYDTGVISGIKEMDDWLRTFGHQTATGKYAITTGQESLVVSILSAGTFVGALLAAPVGDFIGRKWGVVFSTLIFSIGVALQTGTLNMDVFVVGRVFAGLGVGMMSTLVPMYQSECAPKWIRGAVVSCYQWAITIGLLVAAIANNGTKNRPDHSAWRIPIALQFIWAGILALARAR
ncbi:sugar (and other) transporter domain-containing protein [Rhizoctonia solani AG-1 IA]|uniref:Sugar (And other) transporter domain-containing protein n=1 Tax=Thanatephorus cucumeris (strain AG1-IA) TaxID=983506 RepID=L8X3Q5_THACA|nr:sugar (and other) transporter domain-containing protein [Rhizoctonia solani AG-1 IA]